MKVSLKGERQNKKKVLKPINWGCNWQEDHWTREAMSLTVTLRGGIKSPVTESRLDGTDPHQTHL